MNRSEMSEMMELTLWTLWQSPYGQLKVSLWEWLDVSENESPYQNEWIQWDMNELKWIERFEVKWVIWRIWLRTTLWEFPYELRESVPIKVTWVISMGISLWVENESPYQIDLNDLSGNLPMSR